MANVILIKHDSREYRDTVALRQRILREPLGLSFTPDELEQESSSFHLACYVDETIVGCLVLKPEQENSLAMRQVAVDGELQGQGIGKALVAFAEALARQHGYQEIALHARQTAVPFYLKLGYEIEGHPFEEVTLPHRSMYKRI